MSEELTLDGWAWDSSRRCFHKNGHWMLPGVMATRVDAALASKDAELARLREALTGALEHDCDGYYGYLDKEKIRVALSSSPSGEAEAVERVVRSAEAACSMVRDNTAEGTMVVRLTSLEESLDALAALRSAKPSQEKKG